MVGEDSNSILPLQNSYTMKLPQENPDGCVEALSAILRENAQGPEQRPKL